MARLIRLIFTIWMLFILILISVLLYVRHSFEVSELEELKFGTCYGQPCFMGLIPGVSMWNEAISALKIYNPKVTDLNEQVSVMSFNWKELKVQVASKE